MKSICLSILLFMFAASANAADGDEICFPLFRKAGANPLTQSCPLDCSVASVGLGTFFCTANGGGYIERYCGDVCYKQVVDLKKLPLPKSDPTNGFVLNQTCIAEKSCLVKNKLGNPKWLDDVVRDFVSPYIKKSGRWKAIEAECRVSLKLDPTRDLRCQRKMADYHIREDLQTSLNRNGCGNQKDWDAIGQHIFACTKANLPPGISALADQIVAFTRNEVRATCISYRKSKNLPI